MVLGSLRQEKEILILTLSDRRGSWLSLEFVTGLVRIKEEIQKEVPVSFPSSGTRISLEWTGTGSELWVEVMVFFSSSEPWSQNGGPKEKRLLFRATGPFPAPSWKGRAQLRSREIGRVPVSKLRAWIWDQMVRIQEMVLESETLFRSIPISPSRPRYFLERIRNRVEEPLSFPLKPVLVQNRILLIPAIEGGEEEKELWQEGNRNRIGFWFPNDKISAKAMGSWFGDKGRALLVLNQG